MSATFPPERPTRRHAGSEAGPHAPGPPARTRSRGPQIVFWIYLALLTVLLVIPVPEHLPFFRRLVRDMPGPEMPVDKLMHTAAYLGLFLLAALAFARRPWWLVTGLMFAACAVHGALTELAQGWVETRQGSLLDWFADLGGLAIALCLFTMPRYRRKK